MVVVRSVFRMVFVRHIALTTGTPPGTVAVLLGIVPVVAVVAVGSVVGV
jgi:hypothetical protein